VVYNLEANQVFKIFNDDVLQIPIHLKARNTANDQIVFEWEHNSTVEEGFVIQRSLFKAFTTVVEFKLDAAARSFQTIDHPIDNYSLYRIGSFNKEARSSFGPVLEFAPLVTTIEYSDTETHELIISPNPSERLLHVQFSNDFSGNLEITLHNSLGQIIKTWNLYKNKQQFEESLDLKVSPGLYFISVDMGTIRMVKRVIVSK